MIKLVLDSSQSYDIQSALMGSETAVVLISIIRDGMEAGFH